MSRHALSNREWIRIKPLLPPRARTGRPPKDHRTIIDALLWLGRTGAPWRDLPERFGPWWTVATRFYRWTRSGPGTSRTGGPICSCPTARAARTAAEQHQGLQVITLPQALAVGADYGLAVLKGSTEQEAAAGRFALFILSPDGQAILSRWGFMPVTMPTG